ncbi:FAD-dependent oxidoreductase [Paenibacillus motobuensis]|uniref:FAD-dependent oxidoreductase n=1 Tax=Paenibacillus TaxID=44249 RepID=UPI00203ABE6A|nr:MULTISPECIES: FAD-dependent oxidoreductase [Paenibacillus]MCM3041476.1 FAD-dependent oxidoreductase [Paenibacillus lutimineralis]MCM3648580.1 FAD-dependent oxidoreductase [Paenibacillus motobuensis]
MGNKILIVGGVAGGASAAARLRRLDENAEIVMFERGTYISFANCGLPYYIGETIKDRSKLMVQTPENLKARFNIDVRINSDVIGVDTRAKKVRVNSADQGTYEESYDYLILSPGAKPIKPPIPGIDSEFIFTVRNIPDTDRIKSYVDQAGTRSAIVIGGGFIGIEMAESLRERGLDVSLIEAAPHILAPFDSEMVAFAEKEMTDHGVKLVLGDGVEAFHDKEKGVEVSLKSGLQLSADLVILAIGVTPDTGFIKNSGIELGARGHIIVNEYMQTNSDGVYAVGDAVETTDLDGQRATVPLAGPANKQGRIAADNIHGLNTVYKGTQGTSIIKVFSLTGASTGFNERTLQRMNIPYRTIYVHPNSHAGYYPGAKAIAMKLLFNDEGRILGAQAFGSEGVDKRIDVIATVLRLKGTVDDLAELELAYAPPFSSAKDPVNMAGYLAQNVLSGQLDIFTVTDLETLQPEEQILLDVRTVEEYEQGHIDGAILIPVDELRERMNELDKDKEIYAYCGVGIRGYIAARILTEHGYKVKNLTGGYRTYEMSKYSPK